MAEKDHLNLITIGHVDHGKSTLLGRLLYDTNNLPEEQFRKLKQAAKEAKKETFEFAFAMDVLKEERKRGVTIDLRHTRFDTKKYYYTVIDAPGHRDFVKNMITGATQADVALLVVSAKEGVQEQTKEHTYLAKVLGINDIIVAINKMDTVDYDQNRFNEVKEQVEKILKGIGYDPSKIPFIPTSAYNGDNIAKKGEKTTWYEGEIVLEALDKVSPGEKPVDKPLRLPVQDVYTITGIGTVPVGRVETGTIKKGDKVTFVPSNSTGEVKSIEMHHEEIPEAKAGDNIGFSVRGVGKKDIARGDVCCKTDKPATIAEEFTAQMIVLNHPNVITKGYTPVFHCNTAQIACTFTELVKKINPKTGETIEENPDFLKTGEAAVVKIKPTKPMVVEKNTDFPELSKFAVRDMGQTVGAGVAIDVTPAKK